MALREPRKPRQAKQPDKDLSPEEIVHSVSAGYRTRYSKSDNSQLIANNVKSVWLKSILIYRESLEGNPPAAAPPSGAACGLFVKRAKGIEWGKDTWAAFLEDVVTQWGAYLTCFAWKTYNPMPGAPDLLFVSYNLRLFLQYYTDQDLRTQRSRKALTEAVSNIDRAKDNTLSDDVSKEIQRLRKQVADQAVLIANLKDSLSTATLSLTEFSGQVTTLKAELAKFDNWAKARGYSKESDNHDAIYGDYELPGKLK